MAERLIPINGPTSAAENYTGEVSEITMDDDLHTIRVHDKVKAGGHLLAKVSDLPTAMTDQEADEGTEEAERTISPAHLKSSIEAHSPAPVAFLDPEVANGTATVAKTVTAAQLKLAAETHGTATLVSSYDLPYTLVSNEEVVTLDPSAHIRVYLNFTIQDPTQYEVTRDGDNQIISVKVLGSVTGDSLLVERAEGEAAAAPSPAYELTSDDIINSTTTKGLISGADLANVGGSVPTLIWSGGSTSVASAVIQEDGEYLMVPDLNSDIAAIKFSRRTTNETGAPRVTVSTYFAINATAVANPPTSFVTYNTIVFRYTVKSLNSPGSANKTIREIWKIS